MFSKFSRKMTEAMELLKNKIVSLSRLDISNISMRSIFCYFCFCLLGFGICIPDDAAIAPVRDSSGTANTMVLL